MRRLCLPLVALLLAGCVVQPPVDSKLDPAPQAFTVPTPTSPLSSPPPRTAWPMGPHDLSGSRAADEGAAIARADLGRLGVKWSFPMQGAATGTPTVKDGVVYAASWKGIVHAIDLDDGREAWRHEHGAQVDAPVTLWEDLALYGDNKGRLTALHLANGTVAWSVLLDNATSAHLYATPIVHDGIVFMGVASDQESKRLHGNAPVDFRGSMAALDARTGQLKWQTYLVPEGQTGAPVWGTPIVAEDLGLLVFGTGNAYTEPAGNMTDSIVALRLADGSVAWHRQATKNDVFTHANPISPDWDFGSTPSVLGALAGLGQKSGVYWAVDLATGEVAWKAGAPKTGEGIIGASAAADGRVFVPHTNLQKLDALDAATGSVLWSHATSASVYSAPAVAGDVVYVADTKGALFALDAATGSVLWNGSAGGAVFGGLSIVEGTLLVPVVGDGFLGPSGAVVAFAPGGSGTGIGNGTGIGSGNATEVRLRGFAFEPARLEVPAGTRVTWTNDDPALHTVTSDDVALDEEVEEGESASFSFDAPGEHVVYCKPHASKGADGAWTGMTMVVVVEAADS